MPRQRSSGGRAPASRAPARPTPATSAPAPQQQRPATTMAAPQQHAPAPQAAAPQGPGLFGQMASTAAGVAVGSSIGHAIGGFFGGGSSAEPAPAQANASPVAQNDQASQWNQGSNNCAGAATEFTRCMDEQNGNMQICNWYLEQLKACQAAAKNY
ncbi:CHCH domain protein [Emericellopsis atlantica]|uniref:CHCH domain protein n=1 Tax=Emericellopsis atlantica TaxID=2614577 RepID=A0A9P8CPJ9_9HYPO|nr:CHCH domain protein [Emericellopsis atlantica]KAG9254205.1 CHCH domain protein [Emericellopsis atlantica]